MLCLLIQFFLLTGALILFFLFSIIDRKSSLLTSFNKHGNALCASKKAGCMSHNIHELVVKGQVNQRRPGSVNNALEMTTLVIHRVRQNLTDQHQAQLEIVTVMNRCGW